MKDSVDKSEGKEVSKEQAETSHRPEVEVGLKETLAEAGQVVDSGVHEAVVSIERRLESARAAGAGEEAEELAGEQVEEVKSRGNAARGKLVTIAEIKTEATSESMPSWREYHEQREKEKEPRLKISMDREALGRMATKYQHAQRMFEAFKDMPSLDLEVGVNFVFGPNGGGKSTLANAIYFGALIAQRTEQLRGEAIHSEDQEAFEGAQEEAFNEVIFPHAGSLGDLAFLAQAGLAPEMIKEGALILDDFNVRDRAGEKGDDRFRLVDRIRLQSLLGQDQASEKSYAFYSDRLSSGYKETRASSRQMLNRMLEQLLGGRPPGSILVIDEFTMGVSKAQQKVCIDALDRMAKEKGWIVIVPDNSGYAWRGPFNRINLRTPEKGLHVPEEGSLERTDVVPVAGPEEQEQIEQPALSLKFDKEKLSQLAESQPAFKEMIEGFLQLDSLGFAPGKTEIVGPNGRGKTTLLNTCYLLMQIETQAQKIMEGDDDPMAKWRQSPRPKIQKDWNQAVEEAMARVFRPNNTSEMVFLAASGLAQELIQSGAVRLSEQPRIPSDHGDRVVHTVAGAVEYTNLIEFSGALDHDTYNHMEYLFEQTRNTEAIVKRANEWREKMAGGSGSTRETIEAYLLKLVNAMPKGGFLFVDEVSAGIDPERELEFSVRLHEAAKERGVTIVCTSNSFEGQEYPVVPMFDLENPSAGIAPPRYKLVQEARFAQAA